MCHASLLPLLPPFVVWLQPEATVQGSSIRTPTCAGVKVRPMRLSRKLLSVKNLMMKHRCRCRAAAKAAMTTRYSAYQRHSHGYSNCIFPVNTDSLGCRCDDWQPTCTYCDLAIACKGSFLRGPPHRPSYLMGCRRTRQALPAHEHLLAAPLWRWRRSLSALLTSVTASGCACKSRALPSAFDPHGSIHAACRPRRQFTDESSRRTMGKGDRTRQRGAGTDECRDPKSWRSGQEDRGQWCRRARGTS